MLQRDIFEFCSEFYEVEKSIEVVVSDGLGRIRIEALRSLDDGHYSTTAYIQERVILQPAYPRIDGSPSESPKEYTIWVQYTLPWTHGESADEALFQALGFLRERVSKSDNVSV